MVSRTDVTPDDATPDESAAVVVVGAGPTGLLCALLLAEAGHRVVLLDRWPEPYPLPRAVGISHETLRALQTAGVIEDLMPSLLFTETGARISELRSGDGELLITRHDAAESVSGWPERASFCQPDLERILDGRVRAHPLVSLCRGWVVTAIEQQGDGVEVRAREHDGAGELVARGRYVVGCDGANSVVRDDAWAEPEDLGFAYDWLVVDVLPHGDRSFTPNLGQILGPPRPTTLVMGGPGRRRWEFMRLEGETSAELNRDEKAWELLAPFDVHPGNADLERHAVYTFRGRWARHWHQGRSVLAGDSAHLMPPFLGEGFNSGIRDALALSWQLDLVLRGLAPDTVLDDYSSERLGHVRQIVAQSVELGRLICVTDPHEAAMRNALLRDPDRSNPVARPAWRLGPGNWLPDDAHAGYLGIQGRVRHPGGIDRLDDVLGGTGFLLLGFGQDPAGHVAPESLRRFAALGGNTACVGGRSPFVDIDGAYERWFTDRGIEVALIRPDHYVFGTAADIAGSDDLVSQLARRLSTGATSPSKATAAAGR